MVSNDIERNANGTFAKGYRGGPGRPKGTTKANFRTILASLPESVRTFTLDDGTVVDAHQFAMAKLLQHINEDNWPALKDFLDRTVGKPVDTMLIQEEQSSVPPDPETRAALLAELRALRQAVQADD